MKLRGSFEARSRAGTGRGPQSDGGCKRTIRLSAMVGKRTPAAFNKEATGLSAAGQTASQLWTKRAGGSQDL